MARITIDLTEEAHAAFRAAVEANGEGSQVNAIRKLVMAYAERKVWFDRTDPRVTGHAVEGPKPAQLPAVAATTVPDTAAQAQVPAGRLLGEITRAEARKLDFHVYAEIEDGQIIELATGAVIGRIKG